MSASWYIGFRTQPRLEELDIFMRSLGFQIEPEEGRWEKGAFSRIYTFEDESVPREIVLFYKESIDDITRSLYGGRAHEISAHGNLKTYSVDPTYATAEERARVVKEKGVKTQHDYYRHLSPERLKFYESALALRNRFNALVISMSMGDEINPERPWPER